MSSSRGGGRGGIGTRGNAVPIMHSVTLTFPDRAAEAAYVRRKSDRLVAAFQKCCALLSLLGLGSFATVVASHGLGACKPWDCDTRVPAHRMYMESLWAVVLLSLLSALVGAATKISRSVRMLSPVCWEVVIAALATSAMSTQLVCSPGYWGRIRGYNSPAVQDADVYSLLLFIDLIVTGTHLTLPIRWFMLAPLQVAGVLLFATAALAAPSGGDWLRFGLALIILTIFASYGKRTIERQERQEFRRFVAEKTLRVETEFKLAQMSGQGLDPRAPGEDQRSQLAQDSGLGRTPGEDQHSAVGSVPSTTESARVFTGGLGLPPEAELGVSGLSAISRVGLQEQWLIGAGQVELRPQEVLGEGSFGRVIRGSYFGSPVAVKLPTATGPRRPQSHLIELCNELRILRRLRHPNVVSLFGALLDSRRGFLAIVLELVDGVSLRDFISPPLVGPRSAWTRSGSAGWGAAAAAAASATLSVPADVDRVTVLADISCALWYLHTREPLIVHGDLKDSNVFVESGSLYERPCRAKLLDFGLSRAITKHAKPLGGTLHWMAPEVIQREGRSLSAAADVFSFSRLSFFVLTGVHPGLVTRGRILELAQTRQLPQMCWPRQEDGLTRSFREITERCYAFDPAARPHIAEVHPVFAAWLGVRCCGGAAAGQAEGPRGEAAAAAAEDIMHIEAPAAGYQAQENVMYVEVDVPLTSSVRGAYSSDDCAISSSGALSI